MLTLILLITLALAGVGVGMGVRTEEEVGVSQFDSGFLGFWSTNYNETLSVCVFDWARGVLLARSHWPGVDFNEESAALQGVLVTSQWMSGVGSTITGGAYRFSMYLSEDNNNKGGDEEGDEKGNGEDNKGGVHRVVDGVALESESGSEGGSEGRVATGSFEFLDKEESGVWVWRRVRATTAKECDQVTAVRTIQSTASTSIRND
jgi:hypothetical protein